MNAESGSKLGIDATKKLPGEPRKLSGLAAADQDGRDSSHEDRLTAEWSDNLTDTA